MLRGLRRRTSADTIADKTPMKRGRAEKVWAASWFHDGSAPGPATTTPPTWPTTRAPWYTTKARPSTADMAAKLRRVIIAARFKASRPDRGCPNRPPK